MARAAGPSPSCPGTPKKPVFCTRKSCRKLPRRFRSRWRAPGEGPILDPTDDPQPAVVSLWDSDEELDKVLDETQGADDLTLYLRIACPNPHSLIPLEGKYGASQEEAPALLLKARQRATRLGITFHIGSQAVVPAAFGEARKSRSGAVPSMNTKASGPTWIPGS